MGYSANTRQANNRTRSAGPAYSRLIRYTICVKNWICFYPFLIPAFLGEDKCICVRCFEIIGEYSTAACTRLGDFLEQVITTTKHSHSGANDGYKSLYRCAVCTHRWKSGGCPMFMWHHLCLSCPSQRGAQPDGPTLIAFENYIENYEGKLYRRNLS